MNYYEYQLKFADGEIIKGTMKEEDGFIEGFSDDFMNKKFYYLYGKKTEEVVKFWLIDERGRRRMIQLNSKGYGIWVEVPCELDSNIGNLYGIIKLKKLSSVIGKYNDILIRHWKKILE